MKPLCRHSYLRAVQVLVFLFIAAWGSISSADDARADESFPSMTSREPAAQTATFVFYNEFWPNAHDAIVRAATDRYRKRPTRFDEESAAECFQALPKEQQAGWEAAVGYYDKVITPTWDFSQERLSFRYHFLGQAYRGKDKRPAILDVGLFLLRAGAPAYRACLWDAQREQNRRWIEDLVPRLEQHEETLRRRIEEAHQVAWKDLPIAVDVVDYVSRYGADTAVGPSDHIQMSSTNAGYQGNHALEMAFHEASHLLMARDDVPIHLALNQAEKQSGIELPRLLWHAILFKTAGWITQQVLAEAGTRDYQPYDRSQSVFESFHHSLDEAWEPYLRGEVDLDSSAQRLLELVPE